MQNLANKRSATNDAVSRQLATEARLAAKLPVIAAKTLEGAIEQANFDALAIVPSWVNSRLAELDAEIRDLSRNYEITPLLTAEIEAMRAERRELLEERADIMRPHEKNGAMWRKAALGLEKAIKRLRRLETDRERNNGASDIIARAKSGLFDSLDDHNLNRAAQHLSLVTGFDALLCLPLLSHIEQFPFQVNTARQVLRTMRGRALLCDEVGLGKTIEAGLILKEYLLRGLARKVLVLAPPALVSQWSDEMRDKFGISFVTHSDPEFRSSGQEAWKKFDRVIASLSTAKSRGNSSVVQEIPYDIVIVDEAHHLRNRDTVNWKFVNGIRTKYILLLTATPAQNNLDELFNLITLLSPGRLKTITGFRREFVDKKDPRLPRNRTKLQELLMDVMIRNTRSQVNIALPPRKAFTVRIELSPAERKLYDGISAFVRESNGNGKGGERRMIGQTLLTEVGSSGQAVAATLEKMRAHHPALRERIDQLSSLAADTFESSKLTALIAALKESSEKALIFTQYRETQKALVEALGRAGVTTARFDGSMSAVEKDRQVSLFAGDAKTLVSTDVGSEGRNLQFCHTIVNYDLPWNPMRIEQRVGRVHRIGQTETVKILNFAARDTVEDYVLQVLDSKINMFELVIGEIGEILGNLAKDQEFDEIVYDLWSSANSTDDVKLAFDKLGDQLLDARRLYSETKEYDEALFGEEFVAEE
jgi:SNF2 family DNA or RNA helicase